MNPIAGISQVIGSLANQAIIIHREANPPAQVAAAQGNLHCPAGTRLVVLIKPDGTRQLFCMQEQQGQP